MENHHTINGKTHYSMAIFNSKLLNYQRVYPQPNLAGVIPQQSPKVKEHAIGEQKLGFLWTIVGHNFGHFANK